jgi:glycosyltransferase involved in cell wall biosynthesis
MKILFVSMPSIHAVRWIENLKGTSFELYWFDVLGRGNIETINTVHQFTNWEQRKLPYIKGEYFLSKKCPSFYEQVEPFLKVTANEQLKKIIKEIQPDIIHSFEMQGCSYPIIKTMAQYPNIKWVYSCWGNDLYYYQQFPSHLQRIKKVLLRIDFLHADCERDYKLASELGFKGKFLGVIPTGAGYRIDNLIKFRSPIDERKIILVKGYQNVFGRGLNIVKALKELQIEIKDFNIIIFGAHNEIFEYVNENRLPFQVYHRHELTQNELLELMGKAFIYIGNSISDGMPNTLLEAIIMGAFPIQSNPGGATGEIIVHDKNGLLIGNPENVNEIKDLIIQAISNQIMMKKAFEINIDLAKKRLGYEANKMKVIGIYENIIICE